MFIRITDTRRGPLAEVMCDICNLTIELDESCDYLTPRFGATIQREAHLAHRTCVRDHPGRFPGWSQMASPRSILQTISEHRCGPMRNTGGPLPPEHRHPQILKLLRDLKSEREGRIK